MTNRLYGLDLLRFFMALSVLFFHFAFRGAAGGDMPALDLPTWLVEPSKYGYLGVSVFFMISGFVIAYSAEGRTAKEFAIARFARLYPTFILAVTLTFLVEYFANNPTLHATFSDYLANFIISARAIGHPFMDGSYWSIVVEVLFYAWVYVLIAAGVFQKNKLPLLGVWLAISAVDQLFLHSGIVQKLFLTQFSGFFVAGIAIYEWRKAPSAGLVIVFLAAMVLAVLTSLEGKYPIEAELHTTLSSVVIGCVILLAPVVFIAFLSLNLPSRLINIATILGGITYPLYLIHQHIGYVIFYSEGHGGMISLLAVMASLVVLALAIYMLFDRHMVKLTRRWLTTILSSRSTIGLRASSAKSAPVADMRSLAAGE